jgi:acyl-CoA synthetase (AMP-forming)/AMP-acid ligase II
MLVIEHLRRCAKQYPQRPAFVSNDISLTYQQTLVLVEEIAAGLIAQGCPPETPIAVLSPNDPRAFACLLGVLLAGAAWVPVNSRNEATANANFLEKIGCKGLFWHSALAEDASTIRSMLPSLEHAIQIDGLGADSLTAMRKSPSGAPIYVEKQTRRICTIVGTGGTTGVPKGVTWTSATWDALLATTWAAMPCDVPPVHLCVAPMTHAAGVLAIMLLPGAPTNVILDKVDPLAIMRSIQTNRITHLYLPPTILYLMLSHPEVRNFDYSSLRYFLITAAPVAAERMREAVTVFGPVMAQCYGQTEAPMILTFFKPEDVAEAVAAGDNASLSSCGRPTVLTEMQIMDTEGRLVEAGESGEIVVRSSLVMQGYLNDAQATEESGQHGWHHTGDIGRIDSNGRVYVVDRKRDMIISGGFNVYPAEIENTLLSNSDIQDCAVIGVPDAKWGEAVKAIIQLKPDRKLDEATVIAFCRERLGGVKTPKSVEFRSSLPRSAVGKVLKRSIRDEFWVGNDRAI